MSQPPAPFRTPSGLLAALLLAASTLAVFAPPRGAEFLNYDDPEYVSANRVVSRGFTADGLAWAAGTFHAGNWHPLTWISHMADVEIWGMSAFGHRLTNALLHALAAIGLAWVLAAYTGAAWRSLLVATLFALHPLHVESVAWVSERKDVLSGLLWCVGLAAYLFWLRRPSPTRGWALAALFAAALMAKPTAVTFPGVLLLLDWWPLGRLRAARDLPRRALEKAPLWVLAVASSAVTILAQRSGKSFAPTELYPFWARLANAATAYAAYLGRALWPADLTVFHAHPGRDVSIPLAILAAALLAGLSVLALARRRRWPWLLTGWLWYLGVLVPMIGLVQVGGQGAADRYTYLSLTGIFIGLAWSVPLRQGHAGPWLAAAIVSVLAVMGVASHRQAEAWRSSETLFQSALAADPGNYLALTQYGNVLMRQGRPAEALEHYLRALARRPDVPDIHNNAANALVRLGRTGEARGHYMQALSLDAGFVRARHNLGLLLAREGKHEAAMGQYRAALAGDAGFVEARIALGRALLATGRPAEALAEFDAALPESPASADLHLGRGIALARLGRPAEAEASYRTAVAADPLRADAWNNLGGALLELGRGEEGLAAFDRSLAIDPGSARTNINRGVALEMLGRRDEAAVAYRRALSLDPGSAEAAARLGALSGIMAK
jgi:tetratricopeptide (TPR) repeat protein